MLPGCLPVVTACPFCKLHIAQHVLHAIMSRLQTTAMERALSKFGVLAIARTGKISLKRGTALLQMGGWGDSATRRAHQARPYLVMSCMRPPA